jgi:AraC family transcriptional regulator
LEAAAHFLIIHPHKSITEIVIDSGFSSPSVFSRAFKNYFGISAEELRKMPVDQRLKSFKKGDRKQQLLQTDIHFEGSKPAAELTPDALKIEVKKTETITGIFAGTTLQDTNAINDAFKTIIHSADVHGLLTPNSKFIGIIYPHQNLYKAVITIEPHQRVPTGFTTLQIDAGKYASYKIQGDLNFAFATFKVFTQKWLPGSGYVMADIFGYEVFSQNPLTLSYEKIQREIFIAVKPE